jgi:hypothetical protein
MTHNTLYERFVDEGDNQVQGYIAYGLYKNAKREWVVGFKEANQRDPTPDEVAGYVSAYTEQTIATYETQAAAVLAAFAEGAIADARADIVEEALRGSFWGSVWQSIFANALYTLILVALVFALALAGVDILGLFEKIAGK